MKKPAVTARPRRTPARRSTDRPYWNPKNETMPRADRERLQVIKLRRQAEWAVARSPFWRDRFRRARIDPASIRSLADLRRLPLLARDEWMDAQARKPLFGDLL